MNQMKFVSIFFTTLFLISIQGHAQENTIRIPLNTFVKQPADLFDRANKELSFGELEKRYSKFKDLSKFDPAENKYWQNGKYSAVDLALHNQMPSQNETVLFDDYLGAVRELGIFSIYVRPEKNQKLRYGLTFGLQVHASLLKSALLRKAGFYQESPKYLQTIKMKFSSLEKLDQFINTAFCESGPSEEAIDCLSLDPFKRGFLSEKNEKEFTIDLHGAYIEKFNAEIPGLFDGLTPATDNNLQYLAQARGFRALAVPFVMGDVGESLNRFSPQAVKVRSGWAEMNFLSNLYFNYLTSHDDMKWGLNKYKELTQTDWDEIVEAGHFPACTVPLVKSLLLHRYRNMLESFFSTSEAAQATQKLFIQPLKSINTSCVKDGRVTTQTIEGYPQRFSHGPRKSPFESADLIKYMKIATQSATVQVALNQLNEKLQKYKLLKQVTNGVEFGPNGMRLLQDTSGVHLGVNFNANRLITTGTFYGSQAPVQMVDTVSISGGIGYQNIFDGLNGIRRNYGASAAYIRTFTHVVPITSMKQAEKTPWSQLLVNSRLKELASPLKDGKLNEFLQNLKIGEVFTITDSIGKGGSIGWTSGLDAMFGFVKGLSASVSVDISKQVVLRQVQLSRTKEGLQIFVRDVDSNMLDAEGNQKPEHAQSTSVYGVTFDVNYYINIFKLRLQKSLSDLHTDAFLIKFDTNFYSKIDSGEIIPTDSLQEKFDKQQELSGKAASALRALIFQSNVDPLYSSFKGQQFEIDHALTIDEIQKKILWQRATQLDQEQITTVYKTVLPKSVDGGEVDNKPITILSNRKGELRGRDLFGFSLEALNAYLSEKLQGKAPQYQTGGQNPSQMPFGFAEWRVIRTDSEITQGREGALPTVSVIEHIWSGWSLKRAQMDQILNELKEKMKDIKFSAPIIPEGALGNVTKVDFFRVTSHLSLLPNAINQVKELVLAPEAATAQVQKAKFLSRFFQKLSEIGGKSRGQDLAVYNNLMKLMGNGDEAQGRANYKAQCEINKQQNYTYTWLYGTGYECLEPWAEKIIKLSREFPMNDIRKQNRWINEILYVFDEQIPQAYFLNYLGSDKFIYYIQITGFRAGDEDGDDGEYISNSPGEPSEPAPYANGLFSIFNKSYISPVEFDKQGSF
jgi:hypothetical protein